MNGPSWPKTCFIPQLEFSFPSNPGRGSERATQLRSFIVIPSPLVFKYLRGARQKLWSRDILSRTPTALLTTLNVCGAIQVARVLVFFYTPLFSLHSIASLSFHRLQAYTKDPLTLLYGLNEEKGVKSKLAEELVSSDFLASTSPPCSIRQDGSSEDTVKTPCLTQPLS